MSIVDGFFDGLLGKRGNSVKIERDTPEEIIQREEERIFKKKIRNEFTEQQEIKELEEFLHRPACYQVTVARPDTFDDYIGQESTKEILKSSIKACKIKNTFFPHTIFWGSAGLGKTTLSYLISKELDANLILTAGGQLESKEELMNIFKQFKPDKRNILFIDEVHAVKRKISEMLYSAMEDFRFDYTTKTNRVLSLNLPPFTMIGATTDMAKILTPIRQRFQHSFQLVPYTIDESCEIINHYLGRLGYKNIKHEIILAIAKRSRDVARHAINFTKNILNYRIAKDKIVTVDLVNEFFDKKGIDKEGLSGYDKEYLHFLYESKKAGINTLTKALGIDKKTIEDEIESYLMRKRFIRIATGGRTLTQTGVKYVESNK